MPLKRAIAVIVLVEGVVSIVVGVLMIIGVQFVIDIFGALDLYGFDSDIVNRVFFTIMGVFVIAVSAITIFLAIKFLSNKPNKGIAITFLVICGINAFGIFMAIINLNIYSIVTSLVCIANVTLLIIYLVKLGKMNPTNPSRLQDDQSQSQMNFDPQTGQPINKLKTPDDSMDWWHNN